MKYKRLLLGTIVLIGVFAGIITTIRAQKANTGISVHPSNFDLTINPGETTTQTIYLDNLTEQPLNIGVNALNFTAQGEEGGVSLTQEATNYSLANWISITPKTVLIQPHKSQKFVYTITAPKAAEPGGHFGSLVFATIPNAQLKGSGAYLSQRVGSLILLKIPGATVQSAEVVSLSTDKQFYEFGPVQFSLRVKNKGDVHIQPIGEIAVTGWFGQRFDIQLEQYNVLPGAIRDIPAILKNKLLFGPYNATLAVSYGDKNQPLYGSTTFYAFPVRYGLVILGVVIIMFLLRKRLKKAFKMLVTGK